MSDLNGATTQKENASPADASVDKGKGKSAATEPATQEVSMDEDSSDDDAIDPVSALLDLLARK